MKRLAVYTAIFGGKDSFSEPLRGDFDFVLFTDRAPGATAAIVKEMPLPVPDEPTRSARLVKSLAHVFLPEYEYTVWVDGSFRMKKAIDIEALLVDSNLAIYAHPHRNCSYAEAGTVLTMALDIPSLVENQMTAYRAAGYPEKHGLAATGILMRRNLAPDVVRFNRAWWEEIRTGSRRDQLSFGYVAWEQGFRYSTIPGNVYDNDYFLYKGHRY
jgi:hypothetical protein